MWRRPMEPTCLNIGRPIDHEGTWGAAWGSWGWQVVLAGVAKASFHTPQVGSLSCSVSRTPSGLLTLLAFTTSGEGGEPFNGFKNESPDINLSTVIRRNSFFRTVDVRISVQAGGSARARSQGKLFKCSSRTLKDGDIWAFQVIRPNHKWVLAEPNST